MALQHDCGSKRKRGWSAHSSELLDDDGATVVQWKRTSSHIGKCVFGPSATSSGITLFNCYPSSCPRRRLRRRRRQRRLKILIESRSNMWLWGGLRCNHFVDVWDIRRKRGVQYILLMWLILKFFLRDDPITVLQTLDELHWLFDLPKFMVILDMIKQHNNVGHRNKASLKFKCIWNENCFCNTSLSSIPSCQIFWLCSIFNRCSYNENVASSCSPVVHPRQFDPLPRAFIQQHKRHPCEIDLLQANHIAAVWKG